MKRWKLREEDQCPQCQPAESKEHITQCQDPETVELWTKALQNLDDWLQKLNTDSMIWTKLIIGLMKWNQVTDQGNEEYKSQVAQEQNALGWDLLLEGVASKQWRFQQEQHWKTYKSWKSSKQWAMEQLKKLMECGNTGTKHCMKNQRIGS